MKILTNERGIALVMVLILSLIGLAIVSSLLYMLTIGARTSGAEKFFRTADDAALGGTPIAADMIINNFDAAFAGATLNAPLSGVLGSALTANQTCLREKISRPPFTSAGADNWGTCDLEESSLDAAKSPDMTFTLAGFPNDYLVNAKIVDTVEGNTAGAPVASGGGSLATGGVGGGGASIVTPQRRSWIYRIEVESHDAKVADPDDARERARYSVLYAH